MVYLTHFSFPHIEEEYSFTMGVKRTCYDTFYPFGVVSKHGLRMLDFEEVTILYGGNGSGKTTVLNVIAEKLRLNRDTLYNRSNFFGNYTDMCDYELCGRLPRDSRIITSDDVFDFMLDLRSINDGVDRRRDELLDEYLDAKYSDFKMKSIEDTDKIKENGLYLLDEPENSLSPEKQQELVKFLTESARFFNCQFVISTHSPFILAMKGAKIYDMDEDPVDIKRWTELGNVRVYYDFFKEHEKEFLK